MIGQQLRYTGARESLGIIAKDGGFYWLVHPVIAGDKKGDNVIDYTRVVCHPKWSTKIINDGGLTT